MGKKLDVSKGIFKGDYNKMKKNITMLSALVLIFLVANVVYSKGIGSNSSVREHISMDSNWKFALGHPNNPQKDFNHATGYFSYLAKAGYGDGPAAPDFDDRAWRTLDVPHDWAVEQPYHPEGSHSHGYKAVGRNFPEASVGWYRKRFNIAKSDLGKCISIEFDGVHRAAQVWVNGFYLGRESSGYYNFRYDITDYLNYGAENVITVRADVTIEEGWFYEGAGIYRHVWLTKTDPLHVGYNSTFVKSDVKENFAEIDAQATIVNEYEIAKTFSIAHQIIDSDGKVVAKSEKKKLKLEAGRKNDYSLKMKVDNPELWSLESPHLYQLITQIKTKQGTKDQYETKFGIRTIEFDPDNGFFLNGKHVKIKGTNNHQDHAGVGTAIPDALQEYRIKRLKEMGSNAYRCSHNPPTPELLDACDRLGMLVLDENRLMGSNELHFDRLERMIKRDRNHPSVVLWSLGNEEWAIEGNIKGARIAASMQSFAKKLDPTRPYTIASSGGWGKGVSTVTDVMGYNYIEHGNTDKHHKNFPDQAGVGTEERTTQGTRGIYQDDRANGHMAPTNRNPDGDTVEEGWKYYVKRPYLAGLFYWTGFDYRGEPNPLNYPAVSSQFGILDLCGYPKEAYHYLRSWWRDEPYLKITPHWNWPEREGEKIDVFVYSNCDAVELFLNGKSLGRKQMERNGHLEWGVNYKPGKLTARGYKDGEKIISTKNETTGPAASINLRPNRTEISADGKDVAVVNVVLKDKQNRFAATANNEINFKVEGPGKIIGVGNGDPACHEPDKYIKEYEYKFINKLKITAVENAEVYPKSQSNFNDRKWRTLEATEDHTSFSPDTTVVIQGEFELPEFGERTEIKLFAKSLCNKQDIYVNGHLIAKAIEREAAGQEYLLQHDILQPGKNSYAVVGPPLTKRSRWEELNLDPGIIRITNPAADWKRSAFNGLAQVIVQASEEPGNIILKASGENLKENKIEIKSKSAK